MRSTRIFALVALAALSAPGVLTRAEQMTPAEAQHVAQNHVRLLVAESDWKTANRPQVGAVQPFMRGGQVLGYFCPVQPHGFVVLSPFKEANPLKAYSDTCDLNPALDGGMSGLLKDDLARDLKWITARLGRAPQPQDRLDSIVTLDYRSAFNVLNTADFNPARYAQPRRGRTGAGMDYQEGDVLLTSRWHQFPPYNNNCPDMECSYPSEWYWNNNAVVGCVATAGAQILRYWHYCSPSPPYAWSEMCNHYDPDDIFAKFITEYGTATDTQMAAVAWISAYVGLLVDTDYGCPDSGGDGSAADTHDMEDVFVDLGYSDNDYVADYDDFDSAIDWYNAIKLQLNLNRVMQMSITGHSIVCDGWKIQNGVHMYHMNYGWRSESSNAWYTLNNLPHDDDPTDDFIVTNVVPAMASGSELNGLFYGADGFRYWDRDATAVDTTFDVGNQIQILRSGFYLRCVGASGQAIRFYGSSGHNTRLYLDGDPAGKTRVRVHAGGMRINSGGGMAIH